MQNDDKEFSFLSFTYTSSVRSKIARARDRDAMVWHSLVNNLTNRKSFSRSRAPHLHFLLAVVFFIIFQSFVVTVVAVVVVVDCRFSGSKNYLEQSRRQFERLWPGRCVGKVEQFGGQQ